MRVTGKVQIQALQAQVCKIGPLQDSDDNFQNLATPPKM